MKLKVNFRAFCIAVTAIVLQTGCVPVYTPELDITVTNNTNRVIDVLFVDETAINDRVTPYYLFRYISIPQYNSYNMKLYVFETFKVYIYSENQCNNYVSIRRGVYFEPEHALQIMNNCQPRVFYEAHKIPILSPDYIDTVSLTIQPDWSLEAVREYRDGSYIHRPRPR